MSGRDSEKPVTANSEHSDGVVTTHPAYGTVQVSRVTGHHATLFDSEFKHQHYIELRINKAYTERDNCTDWVFTKGAREVCIQMSEIQWAGLLTSMNIGNGSPCTLRQIGDEHFPEIEECGTTEAQFRVDHEDRIKEVTDRIDALSDAIDEVKLSKKARDSLKNSLENIRTSIGPNLNFVAKMFAEHIETTKEKAKAELHGYQRSVMESINLIDRDKKD